jgi:hypothetical protein
MLKRASGTAATSRSTASSIGQGKYLVKVGPGHVQSESGAFVLDLSAIVNRAMTERKQGDATGVVKVASEAESVNTT